MASLNILKLLHKKTADPEEVTWIEFSWNNQVVTHLEQTFLHCRDPPPVFQSYSVRRVFQLLPVCQPAAFPHRVLCDTVPLWI